MNREILFRGKRIDSGEWVQGYYAKKVRYEENYPLDDLYRKRAFKVDIIITTLQYGISYFEVDPKTVGQFTNLHDKNGTKIFDGDIVRLCRDIFKEKGNYVGTIKWDKNGFGFDMLKWIGDHSEDKNKWPMLSQFIIYPYTECYEIIGNEHDNPSLLKGDL